MNIVYAFAALVLALLLVLFAATRFGTWLIERRHPPSGSFAEVNGTRMHFVHVPAPDGAGLPPIVFIHGASGNLRDQMVPVRRLLEGRAELLFVDRPGHGWSERGPAGNDMPDGQADTIAALMDHLGMEAAIVVGHSFGGAVAASFALAHPDKTGGLLFLSAASHPWPGGGTSWYYELGAMPVVGRLFVETVTLPAGALRMRAATECVFAPNRTPPDYLRETGISLVLRPRVFRANAIDVVGLYAHVERAAPRYRDIAAPTIVVSGTRDTVVYEEIHSAGLARDIPGAELVWVRNLGHKPDFVAPELVVAAIGRLAGGDDDPRAVAAAVEARIADDAFGPVDRCPDEKAGAGEGVASAGGAVADSR